MSYITPTRVEPVTWSKIVREFRDAAGAAWRVFLATPHTSQSKREKILPESYRHGWLVFECDVERRRLAPVPEQWEALTELELEQLCMLADVVPARRAGLATPGDVARVEVTAPGEALPERVTPVRAAEMQEVLAQVIDEICDQPRGPSLDTGELIRVEETLALAAQAARKAVALRRALHENTR